MKSCTLSLSSKFGMLNFYNLVHFHYLVNLACWIFIMFQVYIGTLPPILDPDMSSSQWHDYSVLWQLSTRTRHWLLFKIKWWYNWHQMVQGMIFYVLETLEDQDPRNRGKIIKWTDTIPKSSIILFVFSMTAKTFTKS